MISDFISTNNINARVLSFPSDTTIARALAHAKLSSNAAAKAVPFVDEKMDFFAVIASLEEKIFVDDAEGLFGVPLEEIDSDETLNLTGFEKEFFPPIAVFGVKYSFHPSILKQKSLLFCLGSREYLIITKAEIEKSSNLNEPLI